MVHPIALSVTRCIKQGMVLSQMGNAMVSLRRLSQYLVMEERRDTVEPMDRIGLDIEGGQFYWCEPPKTKKLDSVKGAPGQGKKRSLLSVFGGLKLRKGPAVGTGPAKDSGLHSLWVCMLDLLSCLTQEWCMVCTFLQSSLCIWVVVLHCKSGTRNPCLTRRKSLLHKQQVASLLPQHQLCVTVIMLSILS